MAASQDNNKSSPHSEPMKRGDSMAGNLLVATTKVPNLSPEEAYECSEASSQYKEAKQLLHEGKFEEALASIEGGIAVVKDMMPEAAMAPFHYLYGTTLLYQLEESNNTDVTVATETATNTDDNADDMQIAWENLEAARILVETILSPAPEDATKSSVKKKLELDLAQIALRSADLQRINGRYNEAIQDYQTCLELRKLHLGEHDRKIADCFYNIALSNLLFCTELQKEATDSKNSAEATNHEIRARDYREAAIDRYLDCARTLCGEIASVCGKQPSQILDAANLEAGAIQDTNQTTSAQHSETLRRWRQAISSLSAAMQVDENLKDLVEMLDEIQETVDEAEKSQDAIREAFMLKKQAREGVVEAQTETGNGATATRIGFDKPIMSTSKVVDLASESAKSVMVVRKKQKRDREGDSKPMVGAKKTKAA